MANAREQRQRLIHIWLDNEIHRALKIAAAEDGISIRQFVTELLKRSLGRRWPSVRL